MDRLDYKEKNFHYVVKKNKILGKEAKRIVIYLSSGGEKYFGYCILDIDIDTEVEFDVETVIED